MKKPRRADMILSLRLEPDLREFVEKRAEVERRTYASVVRYIIAQALQAEARQQTDAA